MIEDDLLVDGFRVTLIRSHLEEAYEMFSHSPGQIPMSYLSWISQMGMREAVDEPLTEAQVSAGMTYLSEQVTEITEWMQPAVEVILALHIRQLRAHPVVKLVYGASKE